MFYFYNRFFFYNWTTSVSAQQYQIEPLSPILLFFNPFRVSILFSAPWKHLWFSDISEGYRKLALTSTGLILVVHRNYNVLQSVLKTIDWKNKPIYLKFEILNSVVSKSMFRILQFHNLGAIWVWGVGGGWECTYLLLWRIRFVYNFVRLNLISHAF